MPVVLLLVALCGFLHEGYGAYPGKIPGPRHVNDSIAIVGAGPSGVHMAYLLKNKGFKNIEIFEAENRIGGKAVTITHRGQPNDIGAILLLSSYRVIRDLVNKYLPGQLVPWNAPSVYWLTDPGTGNLTVASSLTQETIKYAMQHLQTNDVNVANAAIVQTLQKYIQLHREMFGDFEGFIFPEPDWPIKYRFLGSTWDFMTRNGLEIMYPIYNIVMTVYGEGFIEELPAIYCFAFVTPTLVQDMLNRLTGQPSIGSSVIKSGFQSLFEEMVRLENFTVHLSSPVKYLRRSNNFRTVHLTINPSTGPEYEREFDFVIWSPEMRTSLENWKDPTQKEYFNFLRMEPHFYSGVLIDTLNMRFSEVSPTNVFPEHWRQPVPDSIYATYDPYITYNGLDGTPMNPIITGVDGSPFRSTVLYINHERTDPRGRINVAQEAVNFLSTRFGATNITIVAAQTWRYAVQFPPSDVTNGILWRVLEMQGKYGMWYIGSSVSFEATESVCLYNEQLVNNMEDPIQ